jgi:hypothetical protein
MHTTTLIFSLRVAALRAFRGADRLSPPLVAQKRRTR